MFWIIFELDYVQLVAKRVRNVASNLRTMDVGDSWCTEILGNRTNTNFIKVSQNFNFEMMLCLCVNLQLCTFYYVYIMEV